MQTLDILPPDYSPPSNGNEEIFDTEFEPEAGGAKFCREISEAVDGMVAGGVLINKISACSWSQYCSS